MLTRRAAIVFGTAHLLTGLLVAGGVFFGLPARWAPVDVSAVAVIALEATAGAGLLRATDWAERIARVTCVVALALGLGLVTVLSVTAAWLSGIYGPVGFGGAMVLSLVAALALPYLVVVPVVELVWLRPPATHPDPRGARG
ncbi:MAG TPA: hypothetical protein VKU41_13655 [Polyangiaceae bacterium]|nr:hypothetical protein [Polyangiaceae bacterium]